ncbi:MAG: hypothetical protein KAR35_07525 [Candidatus Heimdallarchaeota archaeon]|nr:hypothetical protein [Candidatus Heimdallarchaeota archaeon]MCK5049210.1 hypothetical protein [Candidatus Heimdallarchaeota archaeon]
MSEDETFYARVKKLNVVSINQTSENNYQIKISADVEYWNWARCNVTISYPTPSDHLLEAEYFGEENVTTLIPTGYTIQVLMDKEYPPGLSLGSYVASIWIKADEAITHVPYGDYHVTPRQSYPAIELFGVNISISEGGYELNYDPVPEIWSESSEDITPIDIIPEFDARINDFKLGDSSFSSNEYFVGYTIEIKAKVDYWNKNQDPIDVGYPMICPIRLDINYTGVESERVFVDTGICLFAVTSEEYPTGLSTKSFSSSIVIETEGEMDHVPYGVYYVTPEEGWIEGGMGLYGVKINISEEGTTIEYEIPKEWPETDPVNGLALSLIFPAIAVFTIMKRRRKAMIEKKQPDN